VDLATRRCPVDGFEVDSSHVLAVATTIEPNSGVPSRRSPSLPPAEDLTGTKLGRYVIEGLLGRGGMATVWRAVHEELGGSVAIKVLDKRVVETEDAQERFLREAKVAARLNHDHVVKVIDFARDPVVGSYIVMELLDGRPLDRLLASGPLDEARAIALGLQIADALAAAHAMGIIHRDLKPGNVFVIRALGMEAVKVVDFGIAKLSIEKATALTRPGKLFGTPLYMSPEQWDNADVGPASDVYSLGVVLYEMLTGHLPISGSVMTEMAKNVALTSPRSLRTHRPNISPALDAVVLRCLEKDAKNRFASMAELTNALREAQRTPSRSVTITGQQRVAQNKRSALIFGAVAVVGIAGGYLYASTRERAAQATHTNDASDMPASPTPVAAATPPSTTTTTQPAILEPPPQTSSASVTAAPPNALGHKPKIVLPPKPTARDAGAPKPSAREDDDLLRKN
jgi:serine/threonine protein kinase